MKIKVLIIAILSVITMNGCLESCNMSSLKDKDNKKKIILCDAGNDPIGCLDAGDSIYN